MKQLLLFKTTGDCILAPQIAKLKVSVGVTLCDGVKENVIEAELHAGVAKMVFLSKLYRSIQNRCSEVSLRYLGALLV